MIPSRSTSLILATWAAKALPVIAPGGRAGIERASPCGQVGVTVIVEAGAGGPRAEQIIRMRAGAASDLVASGRIVLRPPFPGVAANYRPRARRDNPLQRHRMPFHKIVRKRAH